MKKKLLVLPMLLLVALASCKKKQTEEEVFKEMANDYVESEGYNVTETKVILTDHKEYHLGEGKYERWDFYEITVKTKDNKKIIIKGYCQGVVGTKKHNRNILTNNVEVISNE